MSAGIRRRPRFAGLVAVLALLGGVAACGDDGAEAPALAAGPCRDSRDESVTVYSGRTQNLMKPLLDAFACDTGIAVRVRWGESVDLALLIDEEGAETEADVFVSQSPGPIGYLGSENLLAELSRETLDLVDEEYESSSRTWIGFSGRKRVLVYNTDNVAASELPDSVLDLTDETYRDRVALPATNGSFEDWFTVFRDRDGDDAAQGWLDAMVANGARYYPNNRAVAEAVGRGEIDMGLVNHYYNLQLKAELGDDQHAENHDFADDDVGSLLLVTAVAVLESSDVAEPSEELIRYLLGETAQTYFTSETFEYPLAAGVEPASVLPPLSGLEIVDLDALGAGFRETGQIIADSGIVNE